MAEKNWKQLKSINESENYHAIQNITSENLEYCLYDKVNKSKRSNYTFLGVFTIEKKNLIFNGNKYADVDSLADAMVEYNKTLPYDNYVYDPTIRESCRMECALDDYLLSLGFKQKDRSNYNTYVFNDMYDNEVINIIIVSNDNGFGGHITSAKKNDKFIDIVFEDIDGGVSAINSIVASYFLVLDSQIIALLDKMTGGRDYNNMKMKSIDYAKMRIKVEDMKNGLIDRLTEELYKLSK